MKRPHKLVKIKYGYECVCGNFKIIGKLLRELFDDHKRDLDR